MVEFLQNLRDIVRWQDLVDILLVCIIVYRVLLLIRGTRAVQMLTGFGIILIVYYLAEKFKFYTLPGIVILKLLAWDDRPEKRRDDISICLQVIART